jgi:hypothetical protein
MTKATPKIMNDKIYTIIGFLVFVLIVILTMSVFKGKHDQRVESLDFLKNLFGLGKDPPPKSTPYSTAGSSARSTAGSSARSTAGRSSSTITCTGNTVLDNGVCKTLIQYCNDKNLIQNVNGLINDPTTWCGTEVIGPTVDGYERSEPYAYPNERTQRFELGGRPTIVDCQDACNDLPNSSYPERLNGANCDGFMYYSNAIVGIFDADYISSNIDAEEKVPRCQLISHAYPDGNIDWRSSTNGDQVRFPGHRDLNYMHTYVKNNDSTP